MMGFAFKYERRPQRFANHAKFEPLFHFVLFPLLVLNLCWWGFRYWRDVSLDSAMGILMAISFLIMFFSMRIFPLTVQDRLIRLEMLLRLAEVLPAELAPRAKELDLDQLIALRFASDAELPELVRWVLDGRVSDRRAIKRRIESWQPDYLRC